MPSRRRPARRTYGAVVLIDEILTALGDVTHDICFTDNDATTKGLTAVGSGAPQLNLLIGWLCDRWEGTQFLGVHQRGVMRNIISHRLSRGCRDSVLKELSLEGGSV